MFNPHEDTTIVSEIQFHHHYLGSGKISIQTNSNHDKLMKAITTLVADYTEKDPKVTRENCKYSSPYWCRDHLLYPKKGTRVIPVHEDRYKDTGMFVNTDVFKPDSAVLDNIHFKTHALAINKKVNLLDISLSQELLETGLVRKDDTLHPIIAISNIYVRKPNGKISTLSDSADRYISFTNTEDTNNPKSVSLEHEPDDPAYGTFKVHGDIDLESGLADITWILPDNQDMEIIGYDLLAYRVHHYKTHYLGDKDE